MKLYPILLGIAILSAGSLAACSLAISDEVQPSVTAPASQVSTKAIVDYSGYYSASFEMSLFVPCPGQDVEYSGTGLWLDSTGTSGFFEAYRELDPEVEERWAGPNGRGPRLFVRFEGNLSPLKSTCGYGCGEPGYGHLSQYSRMVTVTKLIEMVPDTIGQCGE